MSDYFKEFPVVDYRFGDEVETTRFQHLGTMVDILDQLKEYGSYYQLYHIQNGERPEVLSYKLYGSVNYHWTFYLLNDHLRQKGWPIRDADVYAKAKQYYPNTVLAVTGVGLKKEPTIKSDGSIVWLPSGEMTPMCKSQQFRKDNYLYFPYTGKVGKILKVDQQMGFIWTDAEGLRKVDRLMSVIPKSEYDKVVADANYVPVEQYEEMEVDKMYDEFDAPHHYEDADGNWTYPSYSATFPHGYDHSSVNTMNSVSYYQRIDEQNEEQKAIRVLRRDVIPQVETNFLRLLKENR